MNGGFFSVRWTAWRGCPVRDWSQHVRERLGALGIGAEREEEVVAELAGHFEDAYEGSLERSATPEVAFACAFSEVDNWSWLSGEIRGAVQEDPMNERTKSLWLPGLVMLFLSSVLLMYITRFGPFPKMVWLDSRQPLLLYVPWLVSLPVFGALGAYWSRRAGGRVRARIAAGVFPVLMLAGAFFMILPIAILFDRNIPFSMFVTSFGLMLLGWVLIPGAALLLGALPFLRNHSNENSPSHE
jgi:hypothetical protein